MRLTDKRQRGKQAAFGDVGVVLDGQRDFGGDDVQPLVTHDDAGQTLCIGFSADGVRCAAVIADQFDAGGGFAVDQYAHRQWFACADFQGIGLRHDHEIQLVERWQVRAFCVYRHAVFEGMDGVGAVGHFAAALIDPLLLGVARPHAVIQRNAHDRRRLERHQTRVVFKTLYRHRDHFALQVVGPRAADFLRLEGVVFGAMAVDHFDIAATLFGP